MAVEEMEHFEPVQDTRTHVLIDSWYYCKQVRKAAQIRGWDVRGGLESNRVICLVAEDGNREWIKVSKYAAGLGPADWQEVIWPSKQEGQKLYTHMLHTWTPSWDQYCC